MPMHNPRPWDNNSSASMLFISLLQQPRLNPHQTVDQIVSPRPATVVMTNNQGNPLALARPLLLGQWVCDCPVLRHKSGVLLFHGHGVRFAYVLCCWIFHCLSGDMEMNGLVEGIANSHDLRGFKK